jgi:hypothetical protein
MDSGSDRIMTKSFLGKHQMPWQISSSIVFTPFPVVMLELISASMSSIGVRAKQPRPFSLALALL